MVFGLIKKNHLRRSLLKGFKNNPQKEVAGDNGILTVLTASGVEAVRHWRPHHDQGKRAKV